VEFVIGDWIMLDESLISEDDKFYEISLNANILGDIVNIDLKTRTYTINFGKNYGNSKLGEIWATVNYRKATEKEIKKEKIRRVFMNKQLKTIK
jgi:hypothetical protein